MSFTGLCLGWSLKCAAELAGNIHDDFRNVVIIIIDRTGGSQGNNIGG
jgi:hypothetical protein